MTDILGRRVDNVEHDPCRHDAVNDSLQPRSKNRLSYTGFPDNERGTDCVPPCRS